jgi:type I restriction enzyme R subunit
MKVTEAGIERELIDKLGELKYTIRLDIFDRSTLESNFRVKFEELNRVRLTDNEFQRLLEDITTADVFAASNVLRGRSSFERDDGTPLNYTLVNIKDWCKNTFEVVNQLRINTDNSHHRYDVILLINGVPVVQIELKTMSVSPRRAMQQIVDYKTDPGNGYGKTLLCFIQIFVVSNRTDTWYFANNNGRQFSFNADERFLPIYQFASEDNKKITHLESFAEKFLAKCTLGQMVSRYMVLVASEQKLMMMRPYQIYAVKALVECIHQNSGNGYVWHTTGSGKTLTSFKASTLLRDKRQNRLTEEHIDKIVSTYQFRTEEPRYSRRVPIEEIEGNDFNLNISRYISTATTDEDVDLGAVHTTLVALDKEIKAATNQHNVFLKELGLPLLP